MYVDADAIIKFAAFLGAASAIIACLYKFFKWVDNQQEQDKKLDKLEKQHDEDIEDIKKELCVICYGLFATLDGLKQLGVNGNVTDAYNTLERHINRSAHDRE
ncbi:MAG: branched-chain amino acid ABC transporter permease [Anaerotignum sp.]|nr:branched-chain amino acid ABC transporter permease [Anaerotignum sp.]